jgi:hypothetical protein
LPEQRRAASPAALVIAADEAVAPPPKRYTLDGDAAVEARIEADQRRIAAAVNEAVPAKHFVALVLMGGYGRGEGGYVQTDAGPAPYNDYDYFVIVHGLGRKARDSLARRLGGDAHRLEREVGVEVDFALLPLRRLPRADCSLMNAEMRWGHRVVAGDGHVLDAMPAMPFHQVPPGEITRLLLNRGSLLLMNRRRLRKAGPLGAVEREVFFKYLFKAVLACGDAWLAGAGRYHPSYPVKLERLETLGAPRPGGDAAAEWDRFLDLYRLAYRHKFHPAYDELADAPPQDWMGRTVRTWLGALRDFEQRRLGRAFGNWMDYCACGLPKGQRGGAGGGLRNLVITLRDFGAGEPLRRPGRALRYPRERLIATLPLLLNDLGAHPDPCVNHALALPGNATWETAAGAFLEQWRRYA